MAKLLKQISLLNYTRTSTSTGYTNTSDREPIWYYDEDVFDVVDGIYFEAVMRAGSSDTAYMALYDSGNNQVTNSEISTTNTSNTRVRSGDISSYLTDGEEYRVKWKTASGASAAFDAARIIVVQNGTITKTETVIELGEDNSLTTAFQALGGGLESPILTYNEDDWDGTVAIYVEVDFKSFSSSVNPQAKLYDRTAAAYVTDSLVTATGTGPERIRSSDISGNLVDGHEYEFHVYGGTTISANASATDALACKLIIQQSGSVSKSTSYMEVLNTTTTGGSSSYSYQDRLLNFSDSDWDGDTVSFDYAATINLTGSSTSAEYNLYNDTDAAQITEVSATTSGRGIHTSTGITMPSDDSNTLNSGRKYTGSFSNHYYGRSHLIAHVEWTGATAYTKDLSDNLVLAGSVSFSSAKSLSDAIIKTGSLIKQATKSISENLSLSESLDFILSKLKSFSDSLVFTSTLNNLTSKIFQGIISLTEAFSKTYSEFYLNDITSNNNDLTNVGASPYTTDTPFSQSSIAGDFNAADSEYAYIDDGDQTGLDITGDFTLEAWIKLDQLPSTAGHDFQIISKTDIGVTGGYSLTIRSATNQLRVTFSDGVNSTRVDMDEAFDSGDVGNWIHVGVSVDISVPSIVFYKNASVAASTAAATDATSLDSGSSDFIIGAVKVSGTPDRFFDGKIDDVRVWNDIRTGTEISDNYDVELEGTESGLVAYYSFESTLGILTLVLSDTLVLTSSLIQSISKSLSDTMIAASTLIKSFARSFSNTLSLSDSLSTDYTTGILLTDTLNLSENYSFNVALIKSLSDALDLVSSVEASLAVSLSDGLILSSLLTFSGYVSKTLTIIYNILAFITGYRSKPTLSAAQDEKPEVEDAGTDRPVVFFAEDQ